MRTVRRAAVDEQPVLLDAEPVVGGCSDGLAARETAEGITGPTRGHNQKRRPSVHIGRARRIPMGELRRFVQERLARDTLDLR